MKIKTLFLTLMICGACYCNAAETPAAAPDNAPATEAVAPAKKPQQQSSWKSMIVPIGIIVVMILLFSRANKKQQKQRQEMMNKIVKGTKVLLNSGVYGKVIEVKENDFVIEIAENVRVLVVKEGIARVEEEKKEEAK
ncbi:MAG: preprotein translocase subunit YajC [Lentisphaerae bacterium]|nr:preprotein translocase subunit YajC [Lentisphaerota bacterium]